jgi:hypothetical protein
VALMIEGVVCRRVDGEEALRRSGRLEPLHFTLASSDRLMRILGPIVGAMTVDGIVTLTHCISKTDAIAFPDENHLL